MIKTKIFFVKIYKIPFPLFWTKIIKSKKEPKNQQALFQINSCSHTKHQQNEIFMCMNKGGKCCVNTSHQNTLNQTKLQLKCLNNHFLCFYYICNFFQYTKDHTWRFINVDKFKTHDIKSSLRIFSFHARFRIINTVIIHFWSDGKSWQTITI